MPVVLKHFAGIDVIWAAPESARLGFIGSILDVFPDDFTGVIAGSGKLHEASIVPKRAKILGLRGALTAKGVKGDFTIGDPGLLVGDMVLVEKDHDLGIVPHWSDTSLYDKFSRYNPKIISPFNDPLTVVSDIAKCKKIVSSSLHGIVVADAFGIPRRAELFARAKREGGDYKFRDYASSINLPIEFGRIQTPDRNIIEKRQSELFDMIKQLKKTL